MPMLEENSRPELPAARSEQKQRRQMLLALALLLAALILVLVKDKQFWFPSSTMQSEAPGPTAPDSTEQQVPQTSAVKPALPSRSKTNAALTPPEVASPNQATPETVITASNRAVLPPLQVEVVAGDQHRTVEPGNPAIKIDLQPRSSSQEAGASQPGSNSLAGMTDASAQVHLSPGTIQVVSHPVDPNYPLLAKQMKVQGSVILQALIGKEGNIQDLRILSGPTILSTAAREAVKQWRFKPYIQSGQGSGDRSPNHRQLHNFNPISINAGNPWIILHPGTPLSQAFAMSATSSSLQT